jgi:hypothetical protein
MSKQTAVKPIAGVIGFFEDPDALMSATIRVRDSSFKDFEVYTPFPVHGLEEAQGLKRSPVPFVTFAAAMTGLSCGFLIQYYTQVVDWPLVYGGKPFFSLPAFIPVMFECTILFSGIITLLAMFYFNGLPNLTKASLCPSLTNDRFAIVIEPEGKTKTLKVDEAIQFLTSLGAKDARVVHQRGWFDT